MKYQISITPEEIEKMPMASFQGKIHVITHPGFDYARAVAYLRRQKVIGFDTETRPVFSPGQHSNGVALLQLSGPDQAFLFRVQDLGMRRNLCAILANPSIIKVGAACHDDVRGLQRYHPFAENGFVDLQRIVYEWGIRDKSVKKMAGIILGVRISKTQQLSNWEAEVLSEAQCRYAATDAWVCREMYLKLLDSPRNPLTPEQMMPPEQLAKIQAQREEQQKRALEEQQKQASKPHKRRRPSRSSRKKKKSDDSESVS